MPAKRSSANNHLQEAMALLINNQAAMLAQIAENDKERLALDRRSDDRHVKFEERLLNIDDWIRKSDERFERIEAELRNLPQKIIQAVLDQLPRIKKEIGFKS